MNKMIVHSTAGITILGGGPTKKTQLSRSLAIAPNLVAADKGAKTALKQGVVPHAVIGDMDSIGDISKSLDSGSIHRLDEQETTDFEKCLYSCDAPFFVALGVVGSRIDHSLAAMNALCKFPEKAVVLLGKKDLIFLCPSNLVLNLPLGTRLSLFPMATVKGKSEGLEWPIDGIEFSPLARIGTSNRTTAPTIHLSMDHKKMLVILSVKHLATVIVGLKLSFNMSRR